MKKTAILSLLISLVSTIHIDGSLRFTKNSSKSNLGEQIILHYDEEVVGYIWFKKINSFFESYLLHDLYIHPQFRHQGHAKQLICQARSFVIARGACRIYIHPEPFEYNDNKIQFFHGTEREEKRNNLIRLYESCQFMMYTPSILENMLHKPPTFLMIHRVPYATSWYNTFKLSIPLFVIAGMAYMHQSDINLTVPHPLGWITMQW